MLNKYRLKTPSQKIVGISFWPSVKYLHSNRAWYLRLAYQVRLHRWRSFTSVESWIFLQRFFSLGWNSSLLLLSRTSRWKSISFFYLEVFKLDKSLSRRVFKLVTMLMPFVLFMSGAWPRHVFPALFIHVFRRVIHFLIKCKRFTWTCTQWNQWTSTISKHFAARWLSVTVPRRLVRFPVSKTR